MKDLFKKPLAWALSFSMIAWASGIALFVLGPGLETRLAPVISNVEATSIKIDRERQIVHIGAYGNKQRQCEWKAITAMVQKNGIWHQGQVYFTDPRLDENPKVAVPVSRPVGVQSLGEIYIFPAGEKVQVYAFHSCHPLWQTTTFLYELDFSKTPNQTQ